MGVSNRIRQLTSLPTFEDLDWRSEEIWGWLLMTPIIVLYVVALLTPVAFAVYASLFDISLGSRQWEFVAIGNYGEVLQLFEFWQSVFRTVVFMVGSTAFQLVLGVGAALILNKVQRGRRITTALVLNGYLIPTIVIALVSLFMFDQFVGVLHIFGSETLGLWEGNIFGKQDLAMSILIFISSWKFAVFITIFALAQLQSIPDTYYEAAKIAGATTWEMFRDITLPRIKGALLVAVFLRSIFMFNKFDIIWMLTEGGPGYATTTLPVLMYQTGFIESKYGLANALATVMFMMLFVWGVIYFYAFEPAQEVEVET